MWFVDSYFPVSVRNCSGRHHETEKNKVSQSDDGHTFGSLNQQFSSSTFSQNPATQKKAGSLELVSSLTSWGSTDTKGTTSQRTPCLYNNATWSTRWHPVMGSGLAVEGSAWGGQEEACRDVNHISVDQYITKLTWYNWWSWWGNEDKK